MVFFVQLPVIECQTPDMLDVFVAAYNFPISLCSHALNRRKKPRLMLLILCLQGNVSAFVLLLRGIGGVFWTACGLPYALKQPSGLSLTPPLPHLLCMSAGRAPGTGFSPDKLPYSCPFMAVRCEVLSAWTCPLDLGFAGDFISVC